MPDISITFPNTKKVCASGVTIREALQDVYDVPDLKQFIAAQCDDVLVDLSFTLVKDAEVIPLTFASPEGKKIFWHSAAHVLALAVKQIFPDAKPAIGPAINNGFYYDFDVERPFKEDDLKKITKIFKKSVGKNIRFERLEMSREKAISLFKERDEPYKVEILEALEHEMVTVYQNGDFIDLCRGPHLPSTVFIKAFKILRVAGAYWRGDEKNKQLQRIYGIAFPTKDALQEHLDLLEEAKKRDHRKLGKELDLFSIQDDVGPGLVHWHPKGGRIRSEIEQFWKDEHYRVGYDLVYSPHIGRANLWDTSGHLGFYEENMYTSMDVDNQEYYIKPMNCPFHIQIYKDRRRSYRELPLRWAELGTVYRYEKSGVLHGLLRVRGFTQDDAHIFCTPDQVEFEIRETVQFALHILKTFGFKEITAYLSTRPEKAVGEKVLWDQATMSLSKALKAESIECKVDEGGGAFYGPKIDLKIKDALGREWQLGTIQFDFNLPERFNLTYIGEDGKEHRPFMVHRALLGSIERFFGILVEHYAGAFPVWLAPVQVIVAPVSDKTAEFAAEVVKNIKIAGIRVELDDRNEKIGYKIREAETQKIPYLLVVGPKEAESGEVAVRIRHKGDQGAVPLHNFITQVADEIKNKIIF